MTKVWQDKTKRLYAEVVKAAISTLGPEDAEHTKAFLEDLQNELGPVIEAYLKWHPLFRHSGKADRLIVILCFRSGITDPSACLPTEGTSAIKSAS